MEQLFARLKQPQGEAEFSSPRLHNLGAQLLTYVRSNRCSIIYPAGRHDPRRVSGEFAGRQANGQEAANALVPSSLHGVHMLMQVRTAELNGELRDRLRTPFGQPDPTCPGYFRPTNNASPI